MECDVCGKFYSVTHECAGLGVQKLSEREAAAVPSGFAPLYYLRLAISIMRWDDISVGRASCDSRALLYGVFLWILAVSSVIGPTTFRVGRLAVARSGISDGAAAVVVLVAGLLGLIIAVVTAGLITLFQLALCHAVAKLFFGAKGTYVGILRPLSLAWPINVVTLIPVAGPIVAAILWAAITMVVFEEVNHISRLQAFGIAYGVNILFFGLTRSLLS